MQFAICNYNFFEKQTCVSLTSIDSSYLNEWLWDSLYFMWKNRNKIKYLVILIITIYSFFDNFTLILLYTE